jgi:hypothetical protein
MIASLGIIIVILMIMLKRATDKINLLVDHIDFLEEHIHKIKNKEIQ